MTKQLPVLLVVLFVLLAGLDPVMAQQVAADEAAEPGIVVTLTDPGDEPRRVLTYTLPEGLRESFAMDMKMKIGMEIGGQPPNETDIPTMRFVTQAEVVEKVDDAARVVFTFTEVHLLEDGDVPDMAREQMGGMLGQFKGLKMTCLVQPNGQTSDLVVDGVEKLGPEIRQQLAQIEQSMAQISTALPAEPVGKNATWHTDHDLNTGVMPLRQRTTFTLKEIDGDELTLSVVVSQQVDPQMIEEAGQQVELRRFEGGGEGSVELDLRHLAPTGDITARNKIEMVGGGQEVDMTTEVRVRMAPIDDEDDGE